MVKKWITWVNLGISGSIGICLLLALILLWMRPTEFPFHDLTARKSNIPRNAFARTPSDYNAISSPALQLTFSPLSVQLPDLRRYLIYYGKNGRPDADLANPIIYLAFTGNKIPAGVSPGQRLYLLYDKKQTPNQYIFSPNNTPTPLWLEAIAQGNQALIKVGMKGENEQIIHEPAAYAEFTLPEKEFVRFGGTNSPPWELGKLRVDGTLLARQKARWFGLDRFLEKYGGEEYKDLQSTQRIDFGEGDDMYSVYLKPSSCLIWNDDRWQSAAPGESSINHAMLCVKKIDERVMNLELWDVQGKGKIVLNLIKTHEAWLPQNLEDSFKFVGARTRSQLIFEINHERILLRPNDWLVQTDGEWKKLETPAAIDAYVERKIIGPLFVFDHIEKKDDRPVVFGTFFNAARTEMVDVEFTLQQNSSASPPPPAEENRPSIEEKVRKIRESEPPRNIPED